MKRIAVRLRMPQSQVLREAIRHYEPRAGQLSIEESRRRVALFDRVVAAIPARPAGETDKEIRAIRRSRRTGWRNDKAQ